MKKLRTYELILPGDTETPITLYAKYVGDNIGFLLESREQPKGRYSFMSANPKIVIEGHGDKRTIIENNQQRKVTSKGLKLIEEEMNNYDVTNTTKLPFAGGAVGTVAFDMIKQYENIPSNNLDDIEAPDLHLMFVEEYLAYDHHFSQTHIVVLDEDTEDGKIRAKTRIEEIQELLGISSTLGIARTKGEFNFSSNMSKDEFIEIVEKAKEYIYDGDIFQVVLSQRWEAEFKDDPFMLYRKLRIVNPSPYLIYFNFDCYQVIGSSPEMLVELKDGNIKNCPIAGTRKRGKTIEEDEMLAQDLLNDEKERAEHNMLVDLGRNDVGKVAEIGTVEVTEYMQVHNYSHVMHLVSLVEGKLRKGVSMYDCLMSFLPAGTLSGAPKIRALEIIDELEPTKRGIYGGAAGYFGFNGNMDMCITIRTMVVKNNKLYVQAGAGIVADSVPVKEYEETNQKAAALIAAINN